MSFLRSLYLDARVFILLAGTVALFLLAYFFPVLFSVARAGIWVVVAFVLLDILIIFRAGEGVRAVRELPEKFSNGDENRVRIVLENHYNFTVSVGVVDELPVQFQTRDLEFYTTIRSGHEKVLEYSVRPVERGEYRFGAINILVSGPLRLARRRFCAGEDRMVPVYPSFLQMRRYELLAISNRLAEAGIKKIRRVGITLEFDQIRQYVNGDDYRTINWKATARTGSFMVNQYQDERSQHVYSVIDKGRAMKMPFDGMSLLDYAINTSLVISNIAVLRQDKAGIVTFADYVGTILPAERKRVQMHRIQEVLYNQKTDFTESDFEALYAGIRQKVTTRSLLILYTNFETLSSLQRQLPFLRRMARDHMLVIIFFENTELRDLLSKPARTTVEIYQKTIAQKFAFEKRLIVRELKRYGIHSVLTTPQSLTVDAINKYLEVKARRMI